MNTLRKQALIALTVLGLGSATATVQAQSAVPEGRYGHAAQQQEQEQEQRGKWHAHAARHQAMLHEALKLSATQEPAWATYQAAIKPDAAAMAMHGERAAWAGMTAPARMEKMIGMAKQRTARMEVHLAALNTLYAVLTPVQKQVFDVHSKDGRDHHRGGYVKGVPHAG